MNRTTNQRIDRKPSTCWECSVRCGSLISVRDGRVVRVTGNDDHPYSRGAFCVKGSAGAIGELYHPDRLLHPRRRIGPRASGRWEQISWDDAITIAADAFAEVKRRYGSRAIAGAVSSAQYSRGVHVQQLLRCIGSPNVMINQDLCQGARFLSDWVTGLNASNGEEVGDAACIFVAGRSPSESHVVQWLKIRQAKRRGAWLIVVDPRRTKLAELADLWLRPRPGTDAVLALAMTDVVIREGLYDRRFVERWCHGLDHLAARAAQYPPDVAEQITGVPAEQIVAAARRYATTRPAAMSLGHGVDAQVNAVQTARAYHNLIALTGNLDVPGGNRRSKRYPGFLGYWDFIRRAEFRLPREVEEQTIGADRFPLWCGPESWAVAAHNPSVVEAMLTGKPYPVRALYASGVNVAVTYPGSGHVREALRSLDFLLVATAFMTPTAQLADVVVPKTVTLEEEDVLLYPGSPCLSISQRAVPPSGEARDDGAIAIALRDALRERGAIDYDLMPWNSHEELLTYQLRGTGLTLDDLRPKGFIRTPFEYRAYKQEGFRTPSGKVELASQVLARYGYDPLPGPSDSGDAGIVTGTGDGSRVTGHVAGLGSRVAGGGSRRSDGNTRPLPLDPRRPAPGTRPLPPGPQHPAPDPRHFSLRLMTGIRTMAYHHSRFREQAWARRALADPELVVHSKTAAARGLANGDWVEILTPLGDAPTRHQVRLSDDAHPDVVMTGMGWWYPERLDLETQLCGNVNNATSYGPPWDPILGCPDLRGIPCEIRKV